MNFYERRRSSSCLFSHFPPGLQWDCTLWSSFCILPLVCLVPLYAVCSPLCVVFVLYFYTDGFPLRSSLRFLHGKSTLLFLTQNLETSVGLLNWTTHYLIPLSLRFSRQSNYFLQYFPISIWRWTSFTFSFPDSLRFVLERETWSTIELNGALNWIGHWIEYALNWMGHWIEYMHWIEWSIHWIVWNMHWIVFKTKIEWLRNRFEFCYNRLAIVCN